MLPVIIILLLSAITASFGQVAFKKGVSLAGGIALGFNLDAILAMLRTIFTPYVIIGLLLYALSTLLWLAALSKCSLNFAYPFTAVTFVLVFVLSTVLLKEPLPLSRIIGMAVIIGGIFIVSIK